jgi:Mor family transcriptional regulator
MSWMDEITINDIASERLRSFAETYGLSDAILLITRMPGIDIYIPSQSKKMLELQYIKETFNGRNLSAIAVHLNKDRSFVEQRIKTGIDNIGKKEILCTSILQIISDRCGYSLAVKLITMFPGDRLQVPKNPFGDFKKRYIEKNFTGSNIVELALYLEMSEVFVRETVSNMYCRSQQISLFDAAQLV